MSGEGLKQRKGGKKEEEKPLLDKEDKPKPAVRFCCFGGVVWGVWGLGWVRPFVRCLDGIMG